MLGRGHRTKQVPRREFEWQDATCRHCFATPPLPVIQHYFCGKSTRVNLHAAGQSAERQHAIRGEPDAKGAMIGRYHDQDAMPMVRLGSSTALSSGSVTFAPYQAPSAPTAGDVTVTAAAEVGGKDRWEAAARASEAGARGLPGVLSGEAYVPPSLQPGLPSKLPHGPSELISALSLKKRKVRRALLYAPRLLTGPHSARAPHTNPRLATLHEPSTPSTHPIGTCLSLWSLPIRW